LRKEERKERKKKVDRPIMRKTTDKPIKNLKYKDTPRPGEKEKQSKRRRGGRTRIEAHEKKNVDGQTNKQTERTDKVEAEASLP
jgi:hypothetical protein